MGTVEITSENFSETIRSNDVVILDFWAPWCQPCVRFSPVYERISEEFPDVIFGKIETDSEQALAGAFGITSIPTVAAIREGKVVHLQPGSINGRDLTRLVESVQHLDMSQVQQVSTSGGAK